MDTTDRQRIDLMKLVLMMGIILIHCGMTSNIELTDGNRHAFAFIEAMTSTVLQVSVKSFFILSGFLFFRNMDLSASFMPMKIYRQKLRSRFNSLFVPYVLWCTIAGILLVFKSRYLGFEGHGVIGDSGNLDPLVFLKGYWDLTDGYPLAFAFWFIRNLMIFVILSPVVYVMARHTTAVILLYCILIVSGLNLYGFEYFLLGAWLGGRKISLFDARHRRWLPGWIIVYAISLYCNLACSLPPVPDRLMGVAMNVSVFAILVSLMSLTCRRPFGVFIRALIPSTFFLYAFHELYCTVMRKMWLRVFGDGTDAGLLLTYALSFVTLVASSWIVYKIVSVTAPRLMAVLTGGRK